MNDRRSPNRNQFLLAYGPELTLIVPVAPNRVFDVTIIQPGFVLWYAPWSAPIAIGAALGVRFRYIFG